MKRGLLIGDLHCGHLMGLTPPDWRDAIRDEYLYEVSQQMWQFFWDSLAKIGHFDFLIVNGDSVDGRGKKGTEHISTDWEEQRDMFVQCIGMVATKYKIADVLIIGGTAFHVETRDGLELEKHGAKDLGAEFGYHEWPQVEGVTFDVKHKIGGSSIPHGRATALMKQELWNALWAEKGTNPRADCFIRSHVHYHIGTTWKRQNKRKWGFILPALQGPGSKYGERECEGVVDFGLGYVEVENGNILKIDTEQMEIEGFKKPLIMCED